MTSIFESIRRTPYQSFAAFSVLFFTLFLCGVLFLSVSLLQGLLHYVETRPRIIVYFTTETAEETILQARDELLESGKVSDVTYISKEKAFELYKEYTQNDPLLVEMTSPDILPASLEIDALQPIFLGEIADFLQDREGVDEVQYQKDIVDNLLAVTSRVRVVSLAFFCYLLFMSIIVLTTTTSFKIAMKKTEIELLKLLGATKWYIRKPYIAENVLLGIIATTFVNILIISMLLVMQPFLNEYFAGIDTLSMDVGYLSLQIWPLNYMFALTTLGVTTVFSLFITFFASFLATKKYV